MSTAAVTPVVKKTWLQRVGHDLLVGLGFVTKAAEIAEPFVDLAEPEVAVAYNSAVNFAKLQEAAIPGPGTGPQKLQNFVTAMTQWADQNGYKYVESEVATWGAAVVSSANNFPFTKTAATSAV